jgi:hypothetical protein
MKLARERMQEKCAIIDDGMPVFFHGVFVQDEHLARAGL